ncbi:MAG: DUF4026 domain-containing protein [Lachnospiraceae bacterium]|nr:DUF4026 domain-containing protein [Lachnospiraceae bacterium]
MREPSNMIVIPQNIDDIDNPQIFIENMKASDVVSVISTEMDERLGLIVDVEVEGAPYKLTVKPTMLEVPDFVRRMHYFSKDEQKRVNKADVGLSVCMDFEGDNAKCFYDQLRIIDAMFPEILAVMDCPAEKLLSGRWVSLAAKSKTMPAPRYLFTVQAVGDGDGEVWLHTHGLKRCGMYELEILCSNAKIYNTHYSVIETFAYRMLESENGIEPGQAVFVGQGGNEQYLVCTAVDWKEALALYPEAIIGTEEDRGDGFHSEDTCVLMVYKNPDNEAKKVYTKIQEYTDMLENNPIFMLSNSETERMRKLSQERIPFLKKGIAKKGNVAMVKIGVTIDEEYWEDGEPGREHMWFEVKKINEDSIEGELTNDPYYVSSLKKGDVETYSFDKITDWILFTKEFRITPDDVYLLD